MPMCGLQETEQTLTLVLQELMPNPEDVFAKVKKAQFFLKIDLYCGYWKIVMAEDLKKQTAFFLPLSGTLLGPIYLLVYLGRQ